MITTIKVGVFTGLLLTAASAQSATVQLIHQEGLYLVPVQINGAIILPFILDTGATSVVIPADVFLTLRRTGTIRNSDYLGAGTAVLADGSEHPSERYVLREVRVGGFVAKNVVASVSPVKGEPLLGQTFLSKMPAWTIDNQHHTLVFSDAPVLVGPQQPDALPPLQTTQSSRAVTPCAGNSDEQIILPVRNLYDAIRHKDIDRYADQWRADGVYVRADKGTVRNLEAKLEERRSAFRRWKSVYLNANEVSVDHKEILSATIRVRYLMVTENVNGSISNDAEVLETYDVACTPPSGRWLITKNVDYVRKFDNGK
jgi:hypothetical protein